MTRTQEFKGIISRSVQMKCPCCGEGSLFEDWASLRDLCKCCGLDFRNLESDTWFFMYFSTAAITGFFLILLFFFLPHQPDLIRALVGLGALSVFIYTLPIRKSMALGLDYYFFGRSKK